LDHWHFVRILRVEHVETPLSDGACFGPSHEA
jgi:hypothetical protein